MKKKCKIGDKIPNFKIPLSNGNSLDSKDIKDKKYVLYFYPKDNTPGCTTEAKDFSSKIREFKKLNTEVIGISKDSIEAHLKFIDKQELRIILASDEDGKVIEKFGVWVEKNMYGRKYMGIQRSTFLINEQSKIEYIWDKVRVKGHIEDVIDKIKDS